MKVNKPPQVFSGHLHLKYRGSNHEFFQRRNFTKTHIIEIDYNLKEELIVGLTMFDGTEIKFSMISSNLYIKTDGKYKLQEMDEETERQSFCNFELFSTDELMLFDGTISYHKNFEHPFSFVESFQASIILRNNPQLLEIWQKHEQEIMN
ncbi:MAG: hypothetical protein ACI7YS_14045 [Flavobacterium sp.]